MAGFKLCESLVRARGTERYEITVFGEEPRPAYDRVHLTDFLGGRAPGELALASREWYADHGIGLHTGRRVVAIDRNRREIHTGDGGSAPYDKLVLATGSHPFRPPVDGLDLPNVFVYRTVEDLNAIRRRAGESGSAAVIGGGLLGLEAARALDSLGVECHVIEYAPHVMVTQLDDTSGRLAASRIEEMGIRVRTDARLTSVDSDGARLVLNFAGSDDRAGDALAVDLVVVAAGVRPRIELGKAAELGTAEVGGIIVNDRLETSDPNIYAVGECVSHRGVTYGLVAPCYRMAEVLAGNLTGGSMAFEGADVSTRLKVLGLDVAVIGDYKQPGRIVTWSADGQYRRLVLDGDRLIGASAFGEWPEVRRMQDAVGRHRRLWGWQVARFRREGRIWKTGASPVSAWPDAATVCNCMNLSAGTLRQALASGCRTVKALAATTGASTICGSCRPLLAELAGETGSVRLERSIGLVASGALVLTIVAAVALAGPMPYSDSVQVAIPYDAIWRDGVWRQATGFTLLGLAVAGLTMSIWKRWSRFRWGSYPFWRTMHAVMGVAGLAMLAAHTGMRPGGNLNLVLMTSFVGANVAGAFAGGLVGGALGHGRTSARVGQTLVWIHVLFVWPLPVLVGFHVLSAYFF
jgi:nitrite reductase (NADH) large subunit